MPQRKSKRITFYFLIFFIFVTLNNKNLNNKNFKPINKINIIGLNDENSLNLKIKLTNLEIKNLFLLDKEKIKKIINSNNLVENYSVFLNYPSIMNIQIYKTKFLAQVKRNEDIFFLGSNGKFIRMAQLKKDLPLIFGNFENKNFFELKKAIDETNFDYETVDKLFFFKSGRWDIETDTGILIRLPKNNLKKFLELATMILSENHDKKIDEIDLRQMNQIIING